MVKPRNVGMDQGVDAERALLAFLGCDDELVASDPDGDVVTTAGSEAAKPGAGLGGAARDGGLAGPLVLAGLLGGGEAADRGACRNGTRVGGWPRQTGKGPGDVVARRP
jgi:hypothetical protein